MFKKLFKILIFLLLLAWVGGYIGFSLGALNKKPEYSKSKIKTDAIVVLTGGSNRIQTGLSLFSSRLSKQLFITGVHPSVNKTEIKRMWKDTRPLPRCCITLGHKATTTLGNAIETRDWLIKKKFTSIRLVTSAYHMERALLEFKEVLKGVIIIAHPVQGKENKLTTLHFLKITLGEYNKILYRKIMMKLEAKS